MRTIPRAPFRTTYVPTIKNSTWYSVQLQLPDRGSFEFHRGDTYYYKTLMICPTMPVKFGLNTVEIHSTLHSGEYLLRVAVDGQITNLFTTSIDDFALVTLYSEVAGLSMHQKVEIVEFLTKETAEK